MLEAHRNEQNSVQISKYMKQQVKSYGIRTPQMLALYKAEVAPALNQSPLPYQEHLDLFQSLLLSEYIESKRFGILIFGEYIRKELTEIPEELLDRLEMIVDRGIYEWASCDTFASKITYPLTTIDYAGVYPTFVAWSQASNLWVRRCATVSFLRYSGKPDVRYRDDVIRLAHNSLSLGKERFSQLGAGWLLRYLCKHHRSSLIDYIQENYDLFTREGLRYAIEKLDKETRTSLLTYQPSPKT